ncbi:endonuclease/exonuclease/phosphatase family protein [Vibrio algarum]|uniref:Endonuclease/exonuclease/phosphatase domain-containing protein n=1 Tax=Vibrio algarum TaxID=3020714 RepID=A0ABT4YXI6_9VIBR|nr:endonuclease/exonuclease/phosphatase family protein [Vibrio sp. KJ40-1]MDB1126305.1 hypothetical protein [Vibrio sp. KJ40-1]
MINLLIKKRLCVSLFVLCTLSTEFAFANSILVTSWNIEWLSTADKTSRLSTPRTQKDIDVLASHFKHISPSVLFFQEVDSSKAIQNIIGNSYTVYLSDRAKEQHRRHQFDDINQYTGIAVKKGIVVLDPTDIRLDRSSNSKLRFATYLIIDKEKTSTDRRAPYTSNDYNKIHLLSLHLKAGCSGKFKPSKSCVTLKQQGRELNLWIKERVQNKESFIVAGDFNHNLSYPNDWFYSEITQAVQTKTTLASRKTTANCVVKSNRNPEKTHQFKSLIDHMIISSDLTDNQVTQHVYSKSDVLNYHLSDHCPVSLLIRN